MKRYILFAVLFFGICISILAQEKILLNPIIRDIDFEKFKRIKVYVSFIDSSGKQTINIDSSNIFITENDGPKIIPSSKIFYNSDEGMLICFAMDASFSMNGPPLDNVKKGLLSILKDLRPVDKMGIGYFHDDFFRKCEFTNDKDILKNNINELTYGGNYTVLFKGVMESIKWLKSFATPKRKILIIIGDGDDYDLSKSYTLPDVQKEIKNSGITVYSIGSIAESKSSIELYNLDSLAKSSKDGKYYRINTADDIKNIIPMIYDRIKQEFILEYWSEEKTSKEVKLKVGAKYKENSYTKESSYTTPEKVIENPPDKVFYKRKEFLYIVIGAGVAIIILLVFMIINISKKKKFQQESRVKEQQLREEQRKAREQFDRMQADMQRLMDDIERSRFASQADKEKLAMLQSKMDKTALVVPGGTQIMEGTKRRVTQILSAMPPPSGNVSTGSGNATLLVIKGLNVGNTFNIPPDGLRIGRTEGNYLINDNTVSRRHCYIHFYGDGFVAEDLGSTNGTFVNGKRILNQKLNNGDRIVIGNTEFEFKN